MSIRTKLIILSSLLICISIVSHAQQNNIWYFGNLAGLDFSTPSPQALTNGQLITDEGCATICNANGQLLFYTGGLKVYDRTHAVMPNGNGLMGNTSSSNSAIVIPKPGDSNIYYLFTADCAETHFVNGYRYSEVDMRLNAGLGDINSQKNILLYTPSTERLTAVKHTNGIDYWVITKGYDNNRFDVYLVDCNGINTSSPVTSFSGDVHQLSTADIQGVGTIKASPDGKKLCVAIGGLDSGRCQLFDFNATTGVISNPISLDLGTGYRNAYGVEFSPNNKLLYVSDNTNRQLNQYDISSNNQASINASRYIVTQLPLFNNIHGLQLGPDKKIYAAYVNQPFLHRINNPDVYGAGCNFVTGEIDLAGRNSLAGLPAYITSYFDTSMHVDFNTAFIDCYVQFNALTTLTGVTSYTWDFGDGTVGSGATINHSFRHIGTFNVTLTVHTAASCGLTDSFFIIKPITINNVFAVDYDLTGSCVNNPVSFTDNTVLTLGTITGYSWDFGDASPTTTQQNPIHTFTSAGVYNVKFVVSTSGVCRADSIIKQVYIDTKPTADFNTSNGCVNLPTAFFDNSNNSVGTVTKWLWDFGDTGIDSIKNPLHVYSNYGTYPVKLVAISEHGCKSNSISKPVIIESKPVADFDYQIPCINQGTVFTDHSSTSYGTITKWHWNFGDGGSSLSQDPTHVFNTVNTFPVSLVAESQYGCLSDAVIKPVLIKKVPAFAGNDTIAVYDVPLQLQASGGDTYIWQPPTGLNNPNIANPAAVLQNNITYSVQVSTTEGCIAVDDINVKVYANFDVFVPGSFTPNGDGTNDILKPLGKGLKAITYFKVYNRYGQLVFESRDMTKGWNGTYKGKAQPMGVYVWMVEAVDVFGRMVAKNGSTVLIQ